VRGINIALNYLQILILKFEYSFYIVILLFLIVSKNNYKLSRYSGFKRIFYRAVINDNFRFHKKMKLLHTKNITSPNSMNGVTIPQRYIFHLQCDLTAV